MSVTAELRSSRVDESSGTTGAAPATQGNEFYYLHDLIPGRLNFKQLGRRLRELRALLVCLPPELGRLYRDRFNRNARLYNLALEAREEKSCVSA